MSLTRQKRVESRETSPARLLDLELGKLRRDLRATVRAYAARLESGLAESRAALEPGKSNGDLPREQLHQIRDLIILVRKRKLKPEKGRRKDLRKIDSLVEDLQILIPTKEK